MIIKLNTLAKSIVVLLMTSDGNSSMEPANITKHIQYSTMAHVQKTIISR